MGGIGSGTWFRENAKQAADELPALDINQFVRSQFLRAGTEGELNWTKFGESLARISFSVRTDPYGDYVLWINYRWNGENIFTRIHLESTVPHYSGTRWFWTCPMSLERGKCDRRVAKLYLLNGSFGCRQCHDLTYLSCQRSHHLQRLSSRLGQKVGLPSDRNWRQILNNCGVSKWMTKNSRH